MKFLINLEVELTNEEIQFLKSKYLDNRDKSFNILVERPSSKSGKNHTQIVKSLSEKNIIIVDALANSKLTPIGQKILDHFDRDKKIDEILND